MLSNRCCFVRDSNPFRNNGYLLNNLRISSCTINISIRAFGVGTSWQYKETPFEVLGVPKTATKSELKSAYFKEAKKWHPDLNPNNPKAKAQFQKLANAYEILENDSNRREYESFSKYGQNNNSGFTDSYNNSTNNEHASYKSPESVFDSVMEDVETMKEAIQLYMKDLDEEAKQLVECIGEGKWNEAFEIVKANKGFFAAILLPVIPIVIFFRSPALFFTVTRVVMFAGNAILVGMLRSNNLTVFARTLWKATVDIAKRRVSKKK